MFQILELRGASGYPIVGFEKRHSFQNNTPFFQQNFQETGISFFVYVAQSVNTGIL
jgi:hypothetical protein